MYANPNKFTVTMQSGSSVVGIRPGDKKMKVTVNRDLSEEEQMSVALGTYQQLSLEFEDYQGSLFYRGVGLVSGKPNSSSLKKICPPT